MGALVGIVFTANAQTSEGISPRETEQLWIVIFYLPSGSSSKLACTRRTVSCGPSAPRWRSPAARARSLSATSARCPGRARTGGEQGRAVAPGLMVNRPVFDVVRAGEQMEFPLTAGVDADMVRRPSPEHQDSAQYVQGGALKTWIQLPEDPDAFSISESSHRKSTLHAPWRRLLIMQAKVELGAGTRLTRRSTPSRCSSRLVACR